jgi:hypothetical protein
MQIVEKLTSDSFFVFCKDILQLRARAQRPDYAETEADYEKFVCKRRNIVQLLSFNPEQLQRIQRLIRFQFILEFFLETALDEKQLQIYSDYLLANHRQIFVSIFSSCKNLRVIFSQITAKNLEYFDFFMEYLCIIRTDDEKILATLKCLKKINFFDWLIAEINKFKFAPKSGGQLLLDLPLGDSQRRKNLAALLSLTQFLCIGHGELFLGDLFSFQEKIDNFKTLHQLLRFCLQTNIPELRTVALNVFELLLGTIQRFEAPDAPDHHRAVLVTVLANLFDKTKENAEVWIPIFERLMFFRELSILEKLNENGEFDHLLLHSLDFRGAKLRSLACLQLFRALAARAPNSQQTQCEGVIFEIYSALRNYIIASRRDNIFMVVHLQLLSLVEKYSKSPKFSLIVTRLHPELLGGNIEQA